MGLDMMLYRKHKDDVNLNHAEDVGYWRKANHIHKWFVDHCQGGEDDCQPYPVSREKLEELRSVCQRVKDFTHLATELLPRQPGFFFGDQDIDEWYWNDIDETIQILDNVLAYTGPDEEIYYCSSW